MRFEESSVVFSSDLVFFLLMWGFRPRLKLFVHRQALMMVITIRTRVMIAKKVIDGRAGRYCGLVSGSYIRNSLKMK